MKLNASKQPNQPLPLRFGDFERFIYEFLVGGAGKEGDAAAAAGGRPVIGEGLRLKLQVGDEEKGAGPRGGHIIVCIVVAVGGPSSARGCGSSCRWGDREEGGLGTDHRRPAGLMAASPLAELC